MNSFSLKLGSDTDKSLKRLIGSPGFVTGQNNHHLLSEAEKYTSRVFRIQATLTSTSEQLLHIQKYMNRYPFRKYYMEQGISQLDYLKYHTEVLFHKVHTILEIMRLLLNEVYQLKISAKQCSWENLLKQLKKSDKPMQSLDRYFKAFRNLIDLRHLNSHRGYYEDEEKDRIDLNYGLFLHMQEYNGYKMDEDLKERLPIGHINYFMREYKKKRILLVKQVIEENEKHLTDFLGSLLPEYEKQLKNIATQAPSP